MAYALPKLTPDDLPYLRDLLNDLGGDPTVYNEQEDHKLVCRQSKAWIEAYDPLPVGRFCSRARCKSVIFHPTRKRCHKCNPVRSKKLVNRYVKSEGTEVELRLEMDLDAVAKSSKHILKTTLSLKEQMLMNEVDEHEHKKKARYVDASMYRCLDASCVS